MRIRTLSAIIALILLLSSYYFYQKMALYAVCFIVATLCIHEYLNMTLRKVSKNSKGLWTFYPLCFGVFLVFTFFEKHADALFCAISIVFLTQLLMTADRKLRLSRITLQQGLGILGFLYCGIFPALATRLLTFDRGDFWLFSLMAFVFAGDTLAYITGRFLGKNKLFPVISPKKTIEGCVGGLIGSALAGWSCHYFFFPEMRLEILILCSILTGSFAQVGDLFESLLKRVADIKDSGKVFPGHGGFLDRMDGIYFGAPILYVFVSYLTQ